MGRLIDSSRYVIEADRSLRAQMTATLLAVTAFALGVAAAWVGGVVAVCGLVGVPAVLVAPPDPAPDESIGLGPEGERPATYHYRSEWLAARLRAVTATHPPLGARLDRIRAAEWELETR